MRRLTCNNWMAYLKNWTDNFFFMGTSWVAVSINNIKTRASKEMTSRKNIKFFDFNGVNVAKHWHVAGEVFAISDCLAIHVICLLNGMHYWMVCIIWILKECAPKSFIILCTLTGTWYSEFSWHTTGTFLGGLYDCINRMPWFALVLTVLGLPLQFLFRFAMEPVFWNLFTIFWMDFFVGPLLLKCLVNSQIT